MGLGDRVIGVSGFLRCGQKACAKSRRSALFLDADFERLIALQPDLVLAFFRSASGHRRRARTPAACRCAFSISASIDEILLAMRLVGALVGEAQARRGAGRYTRSKSSARARVGGKIAAPAAGVFRRVARTVDRRHSLGFPELVEVAGGDDVCNGDLRLQQKAPKGASFHPRRSRRRIPKSSSRVGAERKRSAKKSSHARVGRR